jgi:transcriptional regulator with XRE-family HTH domain
VPPRARSTPLAAAIREAREAAGMPRTRLAVEARTSEATVARWELGYHEPSARQLARLLRALPDAADLILGLLAQEAA